MTCRSNNTCGGTVLFNMFLILLETLDDGRGESKWLGDIGKCWNVRDPSSSRSRRRFEDFGVLGVMTRTADCGVIGVIGGGAARAPEEERLRRGVELEDNINETRLCKKAKGIEYSGANPDLT